MTVMPSPSHLARGAWIEITGFWGEAGPAWESHLARGAWIEMRKPGARSRRFSSHLARGAWIEISYGYAINKTVSRRTSQEVRGLKSQMLSSIPVAVIVAPRKRCVD